MDRAQTAEPDAGPQIGSSPETDIEIATQALEPFAEPVTSGTDLEPVLFEESEPLSPNTAEPPASEPVILEPITEEPYLLPDPTGSFGSVVKTFGNVATDVLGTLAAGTLLPAEVGVSFDEALASLFTGPETTIRAPTSKGGEDAESASTGSSEPAGSPLRDAPQPASPFAPPAGGSSLSLLGGSAFGSGGLALLLLCILAYGFVLSRRDGRLSLVLCEALRPSSAFRLPLERPG